MIVENTLGIMLGCDAADDAVNLTQQLTVKVANKIRNALELRWFCNHTAISNGRRHNLIGKRNVKRSYCLLVC